MRGLGPAPRLLTEDGDVVPPWWVIYLIEWSETWFRQEQRINRGARIFCRKGIEAWHG